MIKHLRFLKAFLKDGFSAIVSARALIMRFPMDGSLAQNGTSPQWNLSSQFSPPWVYIAKISCVGVTLKLAVTSQLARSMGKNCCSSSRSTPKVPGPQTICKVLSLLAWRSSGIPYACFCAEIEYIPSGAVLFSADATCDLYFAELRCRLSRRSTKS